MTSKYVAVFEKGESNWSAYVPGLPGCTTVGDTMEETKLNIREAIECYLETAREFGDPIAEPTTFVAEVELPAA